MKDFITRTTFIPPTIWTLQQILQCGFWISFEAAWLNLVSWICHKRLARWYYFWPPTNHNDAKALSFGYCNVFQKETPKKSNARHQSWSWAGKDNQYRKMYWSKVIFWLFRIDTSLQWYELSVLLASIKVNWTSLKESPSYQQWN